MSKTETPLSDVDFSAKMGERADFIAFLLATLSPNQLRKIDEANRPYCFSPGRDFVPAADSNAHRLIQNISNADYTLSGSEVLDHLLGTPQKKSQQECLECLLINDRVRLFYASRHQEQYTNFAQRLALTRIEHIKEWVKLKRMGERVVLDDLFFLEFSPRNNQETGELNTCIRIYTPKKIRTGKEHLTKNILNPLYLQGLPTLMFSEEVTAENLLSGVEINTECREETARGKEYTEIVLHSGKGNV